MDANKNAVSHIGSLAELISRKQNSVLICKKTAVDHRPKTEQKFAGETQQAIAIPFILFRSVFDFISYFNKLKFFCV